MPLIDKPMGPRVVQISNQKSPIDNMKRLMDKVQLHRGLEYVRPSYVPRCHHWEVWQKLTWRPLLAERLMDVMAMNGIKGRE